MSISAKIMGGQGSRNLAEVSKRGQLIVAPIDFNEALYESMNVPNVAFNFVLPIASKQFVIDGAIFSSDKNVSSTNGAVIEIYEASSPTSITPSKTILTIDLGRLDRGNVTGLNIITSAGVWINGKTDDATTNVTILGYYVNTI